MGTAILIVVLVVVVAVVGFFVALAVRGKREFAERTDAPGLAPNAPREWAGAHSPEAKLHRRLAAAAKALSTQTVDAVTIEQQVTIQQQIYQLDVRLVAAAGAPGQVDGLAEIEGMVTSVEKAVGQLAISGVDMEMLRRNQAKLEAGEPDR